MVRTLLLAAMLCSVSPVPTWGQDDDELKPGLVGAYATDGQAPIERIDPDLAFDWTDGSPHLAVGARFQARWTGILLLQSVTRHRFFAEVQGAVTVKVDGQTVLAGGSDQASWIEGAALDIRPGLQRIDVSYQSTPRGGRLKLFWSSEEFATEPVPAHLLFHEGDDAQALLVERGRQLFEVHRCHRCHAGILDAESLPAPALWGITNGTNPEWIVDKLTGKNPEAPHARMPEFGLDRQQADDIAQYLHRLGVPFDLVTTPPVKVDDKKPSGKELLYSLGCLACHQVGELGDKSPYSGGDLTHIGAKRSVDWLSTWLASPERINPQHRMPIFKLDRAERGLLAQTLAEMGHREGMNFSVTHTVIPTDQVDRGRDLVKKFRCANCHRIPAIEADLRGYSPLGRPVRDWQASCLGDAPDQEKHRPYYPRADREALKAFLEAVADRELHTLASFERGRQVLERRQCLGCHRRGPEQGIAGAAAEIARQVPSLTGQTQTLIPPSLNAVGDKLLDQVLDKAVTGNQERARADWLKARMPKFVHANGDLVSLKNYLVAHDRMPPQAAVPLPESTLPEDDLLLTGRSLIGAGGFSCIACHQVGEYVPRNVALGTRGSDLKNIGDRIRPEFYARWTRAPLRVVPGMEMPSYQKPVPGVLGEDVHQQLAAVWKAVGDPRFEAPTNPTQVQQFWQVAADDGPRVVRDVFAVEKANGGGFVSRAFAVGFPNQHGILLDLDSGAVRGWTFGDFARQQTEGKSWFWELAGTPVMQGLAAEPAIALQAADGTITPLTAGADGILRHMTSYRSEGNTLVLEGRVDALLGDDRVQFELGETISPVTYGTRSGWARTLRASGLPPGHRLALILPKAVSPRFEATIAGTGGGELVSDDAGRLTVEYTAAVEAVPSAPIPAVTAFPFEDPITTLPGFIGKRLRLPETIMPTALNWDTQGRLVFTSLKGHVYGAADPDGDGLEEALTVIEEGLAAPFGILADGKDLLVAHKPELLRLIDTNGDGRADVRQVVASGWGYTDDYHDWTTGPVRGPQGELYLGLGSDYSQPKRDQTYSRWRGKVLRVGSDGSIEAIGHEFRYPIGIAFDAQGRMFASDQQGVQNTFNEINMIVPGGHYGVPGLTDEPSDKPLPPAVQIPHPWTRSVNGIFFIPQNHGSPFAGHGIGCEYNGRFLVRFTVQMVDGVAQGAVYPFTRTTWENDQSTFLGPICGAVAPNGDIYVGSIHDSGWLGGRNTGEIVRLSRSGEIPNGIREIRATADGFEIEFIHAVDPEAARQVKNYSVVAYTRVWKGSYATEDSDRHAPEIRGITLGDDRKTARLALPALRPGFVYEFQVGKVAAGETELFPAFAAYTVNALPK